MQHWLAYRERLMTHVKLTGYIGLGVLGLANLSGLVLTWQAAFSRSIAPVWDTVHIVSTFAVLAFVLPHLLTAFARDLRARGAGIEAGYREAGAHGRAVLAVSAVALVGFALVVYAYEPPTLTTELPSDYSYPYGPERPFAPSLATTETGKAYDERLLSGSEGCGTAGCHEQIYAEWSVSAHRYAAMDVAFQSIQLNMANQNGPDSTRYCGGCHDPISLFSGTKNLFTDPEKLTVLAGYREGVSVCPATRCARWMFRATPTTRWGSPSRYLFELEYDAAPTPTRRLLRDFLIRAYPREHIPHSVEDPLQGAGVLCRLPQAVRGRGDQPGRLGAAPKPVRQLAEEPMEPSRRARAAPSSVASATCRSWLRRIRPPATRATTTGTRATGSIEATAFSARTR